MPDMIQFRSALASEVDDRAIIPGSLLVCSDIGEMFFDNIDGERIKVANNVTYLATETDRTGLLTPEVNMLYIVIESAKMYIYNASWVCLNPDAIQTFYVYNVESTAGSSSVTDSRVDNTCTARFIVDPSIYDLYNDDVTCTCGNGTISLSNTSEHTMIGLIEVTK